MLNIGKIDLTKLIPFYYGWIIVGVAGLAHFCSAPGQTYVISIFLEPMIEEMNWSRTSFSGLYTVGSFSAAIFMIASGKLLDRFGSLKMLGVLVVLMLISTICMSNVNNYLNLLVGFMCLRTIGQGSFVLVATTTVSKWFIHHRVRAASIAYLGGALSIALVPILVHFGIENYGWRDTWFALGILVFALLLAPAILFLRDSPEDAGLIPDGKIFKPLCNYGDNDTTEPGFTLNSALKTRSLWMLTLASLARPLIMTGLMFHHVSILVSKGLSAEIGSGTMGLFGPIMFIGNIGCGYLNDKFPNRYILQLAK